MEHTSFDFAVDFSRRVNNRIHTQFARRKEVDGFIRNVLRPGMKCREVDEAEYKSLHEVLMAKSMYMKRSKGRVQTLSESWDDGNPKLP
ncbi:hypothetical protein AAFF27_21360 [Xylophilus sp. GW821-FHT01B05]